MTTVWDLIFHVLTIITDMMSETDFFYSISIWNLFVLMIVIIDIRFIISGIFGGDDDGNDN